MFGLLKEVKEERTLLNWQEDKALLEALENSRRLKEKRAVLEQSLQKAVSIEAENYKIYDAAVTEHLIHKLSDKELAEIEKGYKAAQANAVRARGLIQEHDETCRRLQRGIEILTQDAKKEAAKTIITAYKKVLAELVKVLEQASTINEEAFRLHDIATRDFSFDEMLKLFHITPKVSGLPLVYWKDLRTTGDINGTALSRWQKELQEYGFID